MRDPPARELKKDPVSGSWPQDFFLAGRTRCRLLGRGGCQSHAVLAMGALATVDVGTRVVPVETTPTRTWYGAAATCGDARVEGAAVRCGEGHRGGRAVQRCGDYGWHGFLFA